MVIFPALTLKREKQSDPSFLRWEMQEKRAVLSRSVSPTKPATGALVHVDIMDALPRQETEKLISAMRLWSPTFAKRIKARIVGVDRFGQRETDQLAQVVSRSFESKRCDFHLTAPNQTARVVE